MNKWQPIETAPRDGTKIMVIGGMAEEDDGTWDYQPLNIPMIVEYRVHYWQCIRNCYMTAVNPTHWMPLPKLPTGKTYAQLKGIHKLCEIYKNYINETQGLNLSFNNAKEKLKYDIDYTRLATKDEAEAQAINFCIIQDKFFGKKIDSNHITNVLQNNFYVPKSFAKATLSEMKTLIEKTEQLGRDIGCNELFLTSNEKQQMVNFYEKNK